MNKSCATSSGNRLPYDLKTRFAGVFGGDAVASGPASEIRIFMSPGRVNLIGEHTDYNGGFVFPAALQLGTWLAARRRSDGTMTVRLAATDLDGIVTADLGDLQSYKNLKWGNYQLGVADELLKAGFDIAGCDLLYHDTIPHGAGLSSSAAIEMATAFAMLSVSGYDIRGADRAELAKICQRAENNYIGVNCGIMDQFASAMGKADHAILLDCRDLASKLVPLKLRGYKIIISNTNKKRSLASSKYNERRGECEKALEDLKKALPCATCLGDVSTAEFEANAGLITDETCRRRAEHVIFEDERVLDSVRALESGNLKEFGRLMIKSHESLRDLYEVTGAELDAMFEEALKVEGVIGTRMTGAGFGGCTVSIVADESVESFIRLVGRGYSERMGIEPDFYISETGDGAREVLSAELK